MKMQTQSNFSGRGVKAFSLVEVMVATAITSISFVSLYAGITAGVQVIQLARENLRATQIMVEKMETMRIKSWGEVTNGVDVPSTFVENFYPPGLTCKGITYYGAISITKPALYTNYEDEMRMVTVTMRWTNFNVLRKREMSTFVAHEGMQNYVF
jgi:prepilin-type N-terminal cleavage/methylation domain-containing protein